MHYSKGWHSGCDSNLVMHSSSRQPVSTPPKGLLTLLQAHLAAPIVLLNSSSLRLDEAHPLPLQLVAQRSHQHNQGTRCRLA